MSDTGEKEAKNNEQYEYVSEKIGGNIELVPTNPSSKHSKSNNQPLLTENEEYVLTHKKIGHTAFAPLPFTDGDFMYKVLSFFPIVNVLLFLYLCCLDPRSYMFSLKKLSKFSRGRFLLLCVAVVFSTALFIFSFAAMPKKFMIWVDPALFSFTLFLAAFIALVISCAYFCAILGYAGRKNNTKHSHDLASATNKIKDALLGDSLSDNEKLNRFLDNDSGRACVRTIRRELGKLYFYSSSSMHGSLDVFRELDNQIDRSLRKMYSLQQEIYKDINGERTFEKLKVLLGDISELQKLQEIFAQKCRSIELIGGSALDGRPSYRICTIKKLAVKQKAVLNFLQMALTLQWLAFGKKDFTWEAIVTEKELIQMINYLKQYMLLYNQPNKDEADCLADVISLLVEFTTDDSCCQQLGEVIFIARSNLKHQPEALKKVENACDMLKNRDIDDYQAPETPIQKQNCTSEAEYFVTVEDYQPFPAVSGGN